MKLRNDRHVGILISTAGLLAICIWGAIQFSPQPDFSTSLSGITNTGSKPSDLKSKFGLSQSNKLPLQKFQSAQNNASATQNRLKAQNSIASTYSPAQKRQIAQTVHTNLRNSLRQTANQPQSIIRGLPRGTGSNVANPDQQQAIDDILNRLGENAILHMDNLSGTLRYLRGDLETLVDDSNSYQSAKRRNDFHGMSLAMANELQPALRLSDPANELAPLRTETDSLGMTHVHFQQTYQGIPVWGAEVSFHYSKDNAPVQISGMYTQTPEYMPASQNPITQNQALLAAQQAIGMDGAGAVAPSVEDMIYWDIDHAPVDSYLVELIPAFHKHWMIFVSKTDGSIVHQHQAVCTQAVTGQSSDLAGANKFFNVWQDGADFLMIDTSQPMYDTTSSPPNLRRTRGAIVVLDAENRVLDRFNNVGIERTSNVAQWDPTAVSVLTNFDLVEDYYRRTFNRNSIDDRGMTITAIIHARFDDGLGGITSDNAFWSSGAQVMVFGDGDQVFEQLPKSLDVTGHELTHGVVDHTARLIYENQSGALNEHMADFFGAMIDRDDWLIGDGIVPGRSSLRDMENPGSSRALSRQPASMSEFANLPNTPDGDNGGVHVNSGIPNRMSFLLAEGPQGIGRENAEAIVYRAMATYLAPRSQFIDYRRACASSAIDLFGEDSAELAAVGSAFDAVGILDDGSAPSNQAPTPGQGTDGNEFHAFLVADISAGIDETQDDFFSQFAYQFAVFNGVENLLVTNRLAKNTRPAFSGDGSWALFVGHDNNLYLIHSDGTEETIDAEGAIRTIALSKNQRFIAYTHNDYGNEITVLDLEKDEDDGGIRFAKIQYPRTDGSLGDLDYADILTFNFQGDTLVYDAVQTIELSTGEEVDSWGLYSLRIADLVSQQLIAQSQGEQLGNPTFTHTSKVNLLADRIQGFDENAILEMVAVDLQNSNNNTLATNLEILAEPSWRGNDTQYVYRTFDVGADQFQLVQASVEEDHLSKVDGSEILQFSSFFPIVYPFGFRLGEFEAQEGSIIAPQEITFSDTPVLSKQTQMVEISNSGLGDLELFKLKIEGTNASSFSHNGQNQVIPPGESISFDIQFDPQVEGANVAVLMVGSTDFDFSEIMIPVFGVGTQQENQPTPTVTFTPIPPANTPTPAAPAPTATPVRSNPTATPVPAPAETVLYEFDGADLAASGWAEIPGGFTGQAPGAISTVEFSGNPIPSSQDGKGLKITVNPGEVAFAFALPPFLTGGNPVLITAWARASGSNAAIAMVAVKGNLATGEVDNSLATLQPSSAASAVDDEKKFVMLYEPDTGDRFTPVIQVAATGQEGTVDVFVDRLELRILRGDENHAGRLFRANE